MHRVRGPWLSGGVVRGGLPVARLTDHGFLTFAQCSCPFRLPGCRGGALGKAFYSPEGRLEYKAAISLAHFIWILRVRIMSLKLAGTLDKLLARRVPDCQRGASAQICSQRMPPVLCLSSILRGSTTEMQD